MASAKTTGINIYLSNSMDVLAGITASIMKNYPLQDPFISEKILILNVGMKSYLQQSLAENNSIVALCDFSEMWSFIFDIQRKVFAEAQFNNILTREHMTWNIFSILQNNVHNPQYVNLSEALNENKTFLQDVALGEQIENYLKKDEHGDKAYEFAAKLADAFDMYQMYRPNWIRAWNDIPLKAFKEYEDNPDDPTNPLRHFISEECTRLSNLHVGEDKAARAEVIRSLFENNIWQIHLWCLLKFNLRLFHRERGAPTDGLLTGEGLRWTLNNLDRAAAVENLITYLNTHDDLQLKHERIFIFGVSHFPRLMYSFFKALSRHMAVHICCIDPCEDYWGDITANTNKDDFERFVKLIQASVKSEKELKFMIRQLKSKKKFAAVRKTLLDQEDYDDDGNRVVGHSLLLSYGKQGRDMLTMICQEDSESAPFLPFFINNKEEFTFTDVIRNNVPYVEIRGGSLLHFIQDQMASISQKKEYYVIDPQDQSLSIHVCHTKKREVEVLHDELLRLFNQAHLEGKALHPKDMMVMIPRLQEYAPYINAVFGGKYAKDDPEYIPFVISDRTEAEANTAAQAVLRLLQLSSMRVTASTIIDILSEVTVARRFGLSPDDVDTIASWIKDNSIFWGLDREDIQDSSEIDLPGTFERGLERMLAGSLFGENDKIPCFTDIEGSDSLILGKFWDFIRALRELKAYFTPHLKMKPALWMTELQVRLFDRFFDNSDETKLQLRPVLGAITDLTTTVENIYSPLALTLPVFTLALRSGLEAKKKFTPFYRDKVNFCSLQPMSGVPFKHIFILGLNDLDFPRRDHMPHFNLMGNKELYERCDRSHNFDDRYDFLESLLSAQESLYFSYIGQSPVDKQELNPSLVIKELVYYLTDMCTIDGVAEEERVQALQERLIRLERLNAWHIDNFTQEGGADGKVFHVPSYNKNCINYEVEIHHEKPMLGKGLFLQEADVSNLQHKLIDLPDLIAFMSKPASYFLKRIIKVKLSLDEENVLQEDEDFVLESFSYYKLMQEMLFFPREEWDAFLERKAALGALPYGIFKEKVCSEMKVKASKIAVALQKCSLETLADMEQEVCPKKEWNFTLPRGAIDRSYSADPRELLNPLFDTDADERLSFNITLRAERHSFPVSCSTWSHLEIKGQSKDKERTALANSVMLFRGVGEAIAQYLYDGRLCDITMIDREGTLAYLRSYTQVEMEEMLQYMLVFFIQGSCAPYPMSPQLLAKSELIPPEEEGYGTECLVLRPHVDASFGRDMEATALFNSIEQLLADDKLQIQAAHYYRFFCTYIASHLVFGENEGIDHA